MKLLKRYYYFLLYPLFASGLFACEEVVTPDLIAEAPIVVIDGWITDGEPGSYIILSKSAPFNQSETVPKLTNGQVIVNNNEGKSYSFQHIGEGKYVPLQQDFVGQPGKRYTLTVNVEETSYTASIRMPLAPTLDSVSYKLREDDVFFDDGFYMVAHFQEPASSRNYYFWQVLKNGEVVNQDKLLINSDEQVNGGYLNFELDYNIPLEDVDSADVLGVNLFALSANAYEYYSGLEFLIEAGSPAQAVPENPPTNIVGGALGFFNASAINTDTVSVKESL
ncbi:DUF4249 domain-containing protein [Flammeovirgaceae bacterium SG7u.111]|nr:DUF4249 domain-containing protein [Flammeovirgaceae bacterium SG7u.132]WPO34044.1 DUF4249 domain-containing protein [Flammeovirgaceae bacterium SG7u.111]